MYFKGFYKMYDVWKREGYDAKCALAYSKGIDEILDQYSIARQYRELLEELKLFRGYPDIMRERIEEMYDYIEYELVDERTRALRVIEGTYNVGRENEWEPEEIEYQLMYGQDFSDRHLHSCSYLDEPVVHKATQYPRLERMHIYRVQMNVASGILKLIEERDKALNDLHELDQDLCTYNDWFESLIGRTVTFAAKKKKQTKYVECTVVDFVPGEGWELQGSDGEYYTASFDNLVDGSLTLHAKEDGA
jgi:hypothetical protein